VVSREILPIAIIFLMFAIGFFASPFVHTGLQGQMVSHWASNGMADGWVDKSVGLYLVPCLAAFFYVIFLVIPKIEEHKKNVEHFADQFWGFKVIFVFMMAAIYIATLAPGLGLWGNFDPLYIIVPAIALLFFYVGHMLSFTRKNYVVGVYSPWSPEDERVWEKTNKLGSKLFWVGGALALVSLVAPIDVRVWIVLLPVIFATLCVYFYSLHEYRNTRRAHETEHASLAKGKGARAAKPKRKGKR